MASKSLQSFGDRRHEHSHPVARRLFEIAEAKRSNLVISADMSNTKDLLELAEAAGPYIVVLKTHVDMISDFSDDTVTGLILLKKKHDFVIFEDRKFVDIGSTVQRQYHGGALRISEWADIVNVSPLAGPDIVRALSEEIETTAFKECVSEPRALLILAEMTSEGTIAHGDYTLLSVKIAREHTVSVVGFVAKGSLGHIDSYHSSTGEDMLIFTTGVNAEIRSDELGQVYQTPAEAVANGADFIIVGRGIYKHSGDIVNAVKYYQTLGWTAYLSRLSRE